MLFKDSQSSILLNSKIGFEFEFFSSYNVEKTKDLLSRLLNKKISIEEKAHSDFSPTGNHYKLEPDMSGGQKLYELVTGSIEYQDARVELIKVLNWIKENGSTNERCGLHINISFKDSAYGQTFLSHMNVLKFVLDFDEDYVYKLFPKRESNVYAKSIKYVVPREKYYFSSIENINPKNFLVPSEKYFGVNFDKLTKNYLEFRYLGGDKYENRTLDILSLIDHFIIQLFNSANNREFTKKNYTELKTILNRYEHMTKAYKSYKDFKECYPRVDIIVDLDGDIRRIDSFWTKLRDLIFNLINGCSLKDGILNYDTNTGKLQIKGSNLIDAFKLEKLDLIECKIRGIIDSCDIFDCEVIDAEIYNSNLFSGTKAKGCKVMDCYTNKSCELIDCYVDGKLSIMNGHMKGGIHRNGKITTISRFDKTELIEYEKIKTNPYVKY